MFDFVKQPAREPVPSLSDFARGLQGLLLVVMEDSVPGMDVRHQDLALVLEFLRPESLVGAPRLGRGRPAKCRKAIFRAFVAKLHWNIRTTEELIRQLRLDEPFRRICGFPTRASLPSESTLSRAFSAFASGGLGDLAHAQVVKRFLGEQTLVPEIYRDATDIRARESPLEKPRKVKGPRKKPGPKPKGENWSPPELPRMQRQKEQSLQQMLAELPKACDAGAKKNSQGHTQYWIGYKLHVDVTEHGLPISAVTTSASVHDSQVAIPLMHLSRLKVRALYHVMDAGYVGSAIPEVAAGMDQVAIVAPRGTPGNPAIPLDPHRARRMRRRWQVEQLFSWLKERFGGRHLYVKGQTKAHFHLMCGVLCAFAYVALRI